jgi:glutamyl-tRNA synthetase
LHLGHARTFLIAWWSARSQGGKVLLRIEDLDEARSEPTWADAARTDIEWLGMDWDGEAQVQSTGLDRLSAAVKRLLALGLAYPCICTRGDIRNAASAPQLGSHEPRYPGTCRGRYASIEEAESESGRRAGIRFLVPEGSITFHDEIAGNQAFDVQAEVGDFLIARRDGAPAYQLAVVVDDAASFVNEVVRGADLLASTARQLLLQQALGFASPRWVHVPLVLDESGRRLAKRAADLSIAELRARGVDAGTIVAWVGSTLGLELGARARASELVASFDLSRVPRHPIQLSERELARFG